MLVALIARSSVTVAPRPAHVGRSPTLFSPHHGTLERLFARDSCSVPQRARPRPCSCVTCDGDARGVTLTRTGAVFGTPANISPEAARGQLTSSRSDVYGLGAVLYFVLAGHPPSSRKTPRMSFWLTSTRRRHP